MNTNRNETNALRGRLARPKRHLMSRCHLGHNYILSKRQNCRIFGKIEKKNNKQCAKTLKNVNEKIKKKKN